MLVSMVLSNLVCLLLPALTIARVAIPKTPVNPAADHVKRLSTPSKELLYKRAAILFPGTSSAPNGLALNSTNGEVAETIPFEGQINIPGQGSPVYFLVKGEIDQEESVTVEFWFHYVIDRRIGVFHGDLTRSVDMKIPNSIQVVSGEARLYVVPSGQYQILVFEAYGSVQVPKKQSQVFSPFQREIKRWHAGDLNSIEDVPNIPGVQAVSNDAGVNTQFSVK